MLYQKLVLRSVFAMSNEIQQNELMNQILYVPFNNEFPVRKEIREKLTEKEFFENCFVKPLFDKEIKDSESQLAKLESKNFENEIDDADDKTIHMEMELRRERDKYRDFKRWHGEFVNWLENSGDSIYCILGNAGTGKTTYLHYLQYRTDHNPSLKVRWEILDLQNAVDSIRILQERVKIPNFKNVHYKVISLLLLHIGRHLFPLTDGKVIIRDIVNNLLPVFANYRINHDDIPTDSIKIFFDDQIRKKTAKAITEHTLIAYSKKIADYIRAMLRNPDYDTSDIISELWDVLRTVLHCKYPEYKFIIAYDNIEKFIGTDEISSTQVDDFIEIMRRINDKDIQRNKHSNEKFQTIVFMRNHTSRMAQHPRHRQDFDGHTLDITGWFPFEKISRNKVNWYVDNDISVYNQVRLNHILNDKIGNPNRLRSLHSKLNMLLNGDKRVIMSILSRVLSDTNENELEKFDSFWKEEFDGLPSDLSKFAARTIIMRLVLNVLRADGFFKQIHVSDEGLKDKEVVYHRLGYAREILTILNNYELQGVQRDMEFDTFLREFRKESGADPVKYYFDENQTALRATIAQILFYMNYYDARRDNWLHFIDIEYKNDKVNKNIEIIDENHLMDIIDKEHGNIEMRITAAGEAYLMYVVHSFEYFSCRVVDFDTRPLVCLIPSLEELESVKEIDDLECLRTIRYVMRDAKKCMERMAKRSASKRILYKRYEGADGIMHKKRIISAHEGYINNFMDCIKDIYREYNLTDDQAKKYAELISSLAELRSQYKCLLIDEK